MTTMTLTTAPPVRRAATRPRSSWGQPTAVRGCAGPEVTAPHAAPLAPLVATDRSSRVGVAPLHTSPARLTRRGRIAAVVGFLAVLGGGLAVGQASVATPTAPISYGVVTVQPGQTLWGIAGQVAPGVDPRLTVERLVAVNGLLDANAITAGDQLSVPLAD